MKKPQLSELTLREKIAQTALACQKNLIQDFHTTEEICDYLRENPCGGLWIYGASNVGDINLADGIAEGFDEKDYTIKHAGWVKKLNDVMKIPLLTGTDAESGGHFTFPELTPLGTATALGATDSAQLAYEAGVCIASEVKYGGVNWGWGPVADMCSPQYNALINRTFSTNDVELVVKMTGGQIQGIQDQGVAATIKHFPGVGKQDHRDSHASITTNYDTLEGWLTGQGVVFQKAIERGVMAVMVGHTGLPCVDNTILNDEYIPATLSEKIITGLLKEQMGFQGVVVSDALNMGGFHGWYESRQRSEIECFKAGCDFVLWPTNDDIDAVVVKSVQARAFDLAKALVNNNCDTAMAILDTLISMKEEPINILGAIITPYVDMYRAKVYVSGGMRAEDASKDFNYRNKEFRLTNAARSSSKYSINQLRRFLEVLNEADTLLKSTSISGRLVLEQTITKLLLVSNGEKV